MIEIIIKLREGFKKIESKYILGPKQFWSKNEGHKKLGPKVWSKLGQ